MGEVGCGWERWDVDGWVRWDVDGRGGMWMGGKGGWWRKEKKCIHPGNREG